MIYINNDNINAIFINGNFVNINSDVFTYKQTLDNLKFYILDNIELSQLDNIILGNK